MSLGGLALFFVEHAAGAVLDRLIRRVTGEADETRSLIIKVESLQQGQGDLLREQSKLADDFRRYIAAGYETGLSFLELAQQNPVQSTAYAHYLHEAIGKFTESASGGFFVGLDKARILVDRAICHYLLNERAAAVASLEKARHIAQDQVDARHEEYVPWRTSEPISLTLDGGRTVAGTRTIRLSVPPDPHGALALRDDVDRALAVLAGQ